MKVSVTQENLAKALAIVSRILPARPSLAVLNNILIKTDASQLVLSATNLELAITYRIGAKVETEGAVTVPGRLLNEFVSSLHSDKIQLIAADNNLHLKAHAADSHINGITPEEFPVIPRVKTKSKISIVANELLSAFQEVVVASASDEARPVLNGVLLKTSDQELIFAATDSYRLAETRRQIPTKTTVNISTIIPVRTVQELIRLLSDSEENVEVEIGTNELSISIGTINLISRLIDGKYPDYDQIFPKTSTTQAQVDTQELINATRVSALFARGSTNIIKLQFTKKSILISSSTSEVGENTSTVDAKIKGDEMSIQLNSRYLLDTLNTIGAPNVALELTSDTNPCLIKPITITKSDPTPIHIIMPLRSQ